MSASNKLLLSACFALCLLTARSQTPSFRDVTVAAGINLNSGKVKKYGAPSIVDLDRDGLPDMLFCHHDSTFTELYYNLGNGKFGKPHWGIFHDSHGFSPFPVSPWHRTMRFTLSVGGNYGLNPAHPLMFEVNPYDRSIREVTDDAGITLRGGRGRTAVYLDLSMGAHPYWPDVIYTNAWATQGTHQFAYENVGQLKFALRQLSGGFEWNRNEFAVVTDVDNDGRMEVVSYQKLTVWKVVAPFNLADISDDVLPRGLARDGVAAIAEIDFDGDGDFDLYIARDRVGRWLPDVVYHDILLENRNGRYVDVSERARIPRASKSRGVTAGDFNNDGWVDLHVTQYQGSDYVLLNNGDGTFSRKDWITAHGPDTRGDMAVGVDYDMDGKLDLIMSEGDHNDVSVGGYFRVLKNVMAGGGNYLHVRVGNPSDRSCTPLHAVVVVKAGNLSMMRRVGSPGTSVSHSYLETLHFGLGGRSKADSVSVRYTNGAVEELRDVAHGQTVLVGVVSQ